jgi:hypothetical protein
VKHSTAQSCTDDTLPIVPVYIYQSWTDILAYCTDRFTDVTTSAHSKPKKLKTLVEDSPSLECRRMSLSTNVWATNVRRWWIRRSRRTLSPPFARMTPLRAEWYPSHRDVVLSSLWLTPALRHTTHISALLLHCVYTSQALCDICTGETLLVSCRLH